MRGERLSKIENCIDCSASYNEAIALEKHQRRWIYLRGEGKGECESRIPELEEHKHIEIRRSL